MIFDSLLFMIDPSISQDYWSFIVNLDGVENPEINTTLFPIALLNLFQNISLGIIGGLISMNIVKKQVV
ncbi:hypothetical protein [Tenacibaculum xiamenense]|uniref:hypothetical protein n=1 Tax=Tenacibaculum xiamenense TaxID=1261553 RepID=UPI0038B64092